MNLSFSFLEREIGRLFKRAQDQQSVVFKRRAFLNKINSDFESARVSDFETLAKSKVESYLSELQAKGLAGVIDFDSDAAILYFKKYADSAKAADFLLKSILNLSDQFILDDRQYISSLKSVRDLLASDIEAVARKRVNSYFDNYSKFLGENLVNKISEILRDIQTEISNISENYISFPRENLFELIITNPDFNLSSLINRERQQLRDFEISSGNAKLSSVLHNIESRGGGRNVGRNISSYTFSPILNLTDYTALEGKFTIAQQIFSEQCDLNFKDLNQFKEKSVKLETYSQISGDNRLSQAFISFIRELNRENPKILVGDSEEKKQEKINKFKDDLIKLSSFKLLKEESRKLKIIFRLKFNTETIKILRENKIVQSGDTCLFIESKEISPLILSDSAISVISPLTARAENNKKRLLKIKEAYLLYRGF